METSPMFTTTETREQAVEIQRYVFNKCRALVSVVTPLSDGWLIVWITK